MRKNELEMMLQESIAEMFLELMEVSNLQTPKAQIILNKHTKPKYIPRYYLTTQKPLEKNAINQGEKSGDLIVGGTTGCGWLPSYPRVGESLNAESTEVCSGTQVFQDHISSEKITIKAKSSRQSFEKGQTDKSMLFIV